MDEALDWLAQLAAERGAANVVPPSRRFNLWHRQSCCLIGSNVTYDDSARRRPAVPRHKHQLLCSSQAHQMMSGWDGWMSLQQSWGHPLKNRQRISGKSLPRRIRVWRRLSRVLLFGGG